MENQDYFAFVADMLESDSQLTSVEKALLQEEVDTYYGNLAEYQAQLEYDTLTEDQMQSAYQEYAELSAKEAYYADLADQMAYAS